MFERLHILEVLLFQLSKPLFDLFPLLPRHQLLTAHHFGLNHLQQLADVLGHVLMDMLLDTWPVVQRRVRGERGWPQVAQVTDHGEKSAD